MAHAIRIHAYGGPEALQWEEVAVGDPGPGEVRLRQSAVGLNYIDTYHRTGHYKLASLPAVIGMEGAGTVEAVGSGRHRSQSRATAWPTRRCSAAMRRSG